MCRVRDGIRRRESVREKEGDEGNLDISTKGAGAEAVFGGAGALPNRPLVFPKDLIKAFFSSSSDLSVGHNL